MQQKKILLVDDSETMLLLGRLVLRDEYNLITATNGRAAVDLALAERPDLIVLDVAMPEMDGLQACKALRSEQATRWTPILMLTSRGDWESAKAAYVHGCSAYLTKPLQPNKLLAKIKQLLKEDRLQR